ncbi:CUN065 hypothetical protein [Culex nigripalpus nucleopolyhedrovirus]|uniref:Uncharacterized protein n=1 Tax=Culex nigripalpus nucleopolyhedrovirus (isolate Florida/1997) TaxID=645993 RepID=Q919L1_NPVCO|nr:CUN065 hypothetical protein [Culex nigripalpus nucleopolyhedrovirus]AAK94143.1 CUN065 hypothetical protein [Culex nigripalpus nucleopolyhedrovirus]
MTIGEVYRASFRRGQEDGNRRKVLDRDSRDMRELPCTFFGPGDWSFVPENVPVNRLVEEFANRYWTFSPHDRDELVKHILEEIGACPAAELRSRLDTYFGFPDTELRRVFAQARDAMVEVWKPRCKLSRFEMWEMLHRLEGLFENVHLYIMTMKLHCELEWGGADFEYTDERKVYEWSVGDAELGALKVWDFNPGRVGSTKVDEQKVDEDESFVRSIDVERQLKVYKILQKTFENRPNNRPVATIKPRMCHELRDQNPEQVRTQNQVVVLEDDDAGNDSDVTLYRGASPVRSRPSSPEYYDSDENRAWQERLIEQSRRDQRARERRQQQQHRSRGARSRSRRNY